MLLTSFFLNLFWHNAKLHLNIKARNDEKNSYIPIYGKKLENSLDFLYNDINNFLSYKE